MQRDEIKLNKDRRLKKVMGLNSLPETCPRCGWACLYLMHVYYVSPWNDHGGLCPACIMEAVNKFDREGWPVDPAALAMEAAIKQAKIKPEPERLFN